MAPDILKDFTHRSVDQSTWELLEDIRQSADQSATSWARNETHDLYNANYRVYDHGKACKPPCENGKMVLGTLRRLVSCNHLQY
jgi:hypothetical protein